MSRRRDSRRLSPSRSLARAAERLERHVLALGLAVLAVMAFLTYISIVAINGIPFTHPYKLRAIVPASAPIVKHGDEVDVAGQQVGQVRNVVLTARGTTVEMDITDGRVGRDASATVRLRGLAGSTYVDLHRGDIAHPAPEEWTIPLSRTRANTELTDVIASFGSRARAALGRTLYAYGGGLAGHGQDLNSVLADLPPLLRQGEPLLRAFSPRPGALSGFVHELHRTVRGLGGSQPGDLAGLISSGASTFGAVAAQRVPLGAAIDELRPFSDQVRTTLPIADPVLANATRAVRELTPGVHALAVALPDLDRLLTRRSQLGQLSVLARAVNPVLKVLAPVLGQLYDGSASLSPLAQALEPLAAYLAPYRAELYAGPHGFTTWGGFHYDGGQAKGARAVRFAMVLTCEKARDPYPAPGQVGKDRKRCLL
jgi:virulence factor Mce-like protein